MAENKNSRVHSYTRYPLDASGRTPDLKACDEAYNEPTRLKMLADEYWAAVKRPPPVYAEAINPALDQLIEERGLPPKADIDGDEQARIRARGARALASAYTEILIRQFQRRNRITNANYEASLSDHQKMVSSIRGALSGLHREDLGPGGFQRVQEFPTYTNTAASANALFEIQKQIQESMFTEAFQNRYGTLAEHVECLKIKNGITDIASAPLKFHEDLASLQARYERSREGEWTCPGKVERFPEN
jgi:hypothetical protein